MNQPSTNPPNPQHPQPIPVKGGGGASVFLIIGIVVFVLVFIMGILAAIAIPNFMKFQCRSKQSEAKSQLKSAYVAAESFHMENDRYPSSLAEMEWKPIGQTIRYEYRVADSSKETLILEAKGIGDMAGDRWIINQSLKLDHPENSCP